MATGSKASAVLVYTLLRVAVFLAVWLTIELITPISGVWAIVIAILISGALSIVLLDRPRNRAGQVAAGFFGSINERIEASARAEDVDDEPVGLPAETPASGEDEQGAERQPEGQQ